MLQNDRQITISAGSSRNTTRWPLQTLYWSELVERLQVPTRGTESIAAYLKLTKAQQDNLKDVGGFVGGIIHNGGRRKAGSVDGRDVLTLDLTTSLQAVRTTCCVVWIPSAAGTACTPPASTPWQLLACVSCCHLTVQ